MEEFFKFPLAIKLAISQGHESFIPWLKDELKVSEIEYYDTLVECATAMGKSEDTVIISLAKEEVLVEEGMVTKIDWRSQGLTGMLSAAFNELKRLRELDLRDNLVVGEEAEEFSTLRQRLGNLFTIDSSRDREIVVKCAEAMGGSLDWLQGEEKKRCGNWTGVTLSEQGKVAKIDWCSQGLTGTLSAAFNELTALRKLDLRGNWIDREEGEVGLALRQGLGKGFKIDSSKDREIVVKCAEAMGNSLEWLQGDPRGATFDEETGKVVKIYWRAKQFTGILPAALFNELTELRELDLGYNFGLEESEIAYLVRLKSKLGESFKTSSVPFTNEGLKVAVKEWCKNRSAAEAEYVHISGWNTSEVTNMNCLFSAHEDDVGEAAKQFNDDISRWNVDRVENMLGMFCYAKSFNQDLSGWNVEKCKNMSFMFSGAEKFEDSIKNWDLSGKDSTYMFEYGEDYGGETGEETMKKYKKKGAE
ncbi:hypothetical protein TrLO_g3069 [Triparma laevis f. longispina]|uniref:Uncharacterized protein n=1 Tax=Triparma laevis f. longispina TaxID=1714387 RepID=A0A9W7CBS6_9STRA|nr:hypothetical protein TrLO_g3069 [Triparma laevis f. longispina]